MTDAMTDAMSGLPGVGLPAGAPERPATQAAYPAVHDMPPARPASLLNAVEQEKIESDLVEARERQQAAAGVAPAASARKKPAPAPAAAPRFIPASSSRTIY